MTRILLGTAIAICITGAPALGSAQGQAQAAAPNAASAATSAADAAFVAAATLDANTDLVLGKLAQQNATTAPLRDYGARIATAHRQAVDELTVIALARGLTPPPHLDAAHQRVVDALATAKGVAFDRAFLLQMAEDHARTVATYRREAAHGQDERLKAFARKTLPMLQAQAQAARTLGRAGAR